MYVRTQLEMQRANLAEDAQQLQAQEAELREATYDREPRARLVAYRKLEDARLQLKIVCEATF